MTTNAELSMDSMEHRQQPRRRSGGLSAVLTMIVALALGGVGGTLAAAQTGGPAVPTEPPELPAEFPGAGDENEQYLPVTVAAVESLATDYEYECELLTETQFEGRGSPRGAEHWLQCRLPGSFGSGRANVEAEYDGDTQVLAASATCVRGAQTPEDYCPSLFRDAAETVFQDEPGLQQEAATWAEENVDNDASIVIGGVELTVDLGDHRLTFVPGL